MAIRFDKIKRQNDKALKGFFSELYSQCDAATADAIHVVAQQGLVKMVEKAEFSDYTGSMINSYQAAIKKSGSRKFGKVFAETSHNTAQRGEYFKSTGRSDLRGGRMNKNIHSNNRFGDSLRGGEVVLYTSYNLLDRSKQSAVRIPPRAVKAIKLRKRRNDKSSEYMNRREGFKYSEDGYGRRLTRIKGARGVRLGYAVIFDNPTPYAEQVHNLNGNKVFPTDNPVSGGFLEQRIQANLGRYLQAKRKRK